MKYLLCLLIGFLPQMLLAQSAAATKALYEKGEYEKAKPAAKKLVKQQPGNGNYNLWYGVCCLETGEADEGLKYLQTAVKKRVTSGQLHLGRAYNELYRFEDAIKTFEAYIADLKRLKRSTEEAEKLLGKSKTNLRMLKGVEQVCFIDSFVVEKADFLNAYKISPEAGKLFLYDNYFNNSGKEGGTVYETEMGNRLYYGEMQENGNLNILSRNKQQDGWGEATLLPENINGEQNANYPYVLTDGITIYYAADGEGSMGGYDIFVTRYNTNTDTYLTPENVGMPFNSPFNDYMYVIDEFSNLGWFASDRYQPADKVCVYVFIPNASKRVYNFEGMDKEKLVSLAQIRFLEETWNDVEAVEAAQERLQSIAAVKPQAEKQRDFKFVVNDEAIYYQLNDFRSPKARTLFREYRKLDLNLQLLQDDLEQLRSRYARTERGEKKSLSTRILDMEKRTLQISAELEQTAIQVRRLENEYLSH